jgi:hypothetical protein
MTKDFFTPQTRLEKEKEKKEEEHPVDGSMNWWVGFSTLGYVFRLLPPPPPPFSLLLFFLGCFT